MKFPKRQMLLGLTAAVALSASTFAARADAVEDFYKGKSVTFLVSAPAGSLTDRIARAFADTYAKHIPGQPSVIVQNLAGAGGMKAAAQLQLKEDNDGTVIGFLQRNNLYVPMVEGEEKSGFDPRELNWLGSLDKVAYAIVAMDTAPAKTAADLFTTPLVLGATGFSNENRTLPAMLNDMIGTKFKIIHGYDARGEVYLAMERGEVDGWASTIAGLAVPDTKQWIDSGKMKVLLHLAFKSDPAFPDVPNLTDYITDPAEKELYSFFTISMDAGRPVAVPKGVPADRLAALLAAFDAAVADPAFVSAMAEAGNPVAPVGGAEVEAILKQLYATTPETMEKVRGIMLAQEPK